MTLFKKLAATALVGMLSTSAFAAIDSSEVFATGGNVSITFSTIGGAYTNELFFNGTRLFDGTWSQVGNTVNLGSFAAGSKLDFTLHVLNTGDTFHTGAGNYDGVIHARVTANGNGGVTLGFEDLYGGGDRDYDDTVFSLTNTAVAPVPEPETYALMGMGLVGLIAARRRRTTK